MERSEGVLDIDVDNINSDLMDAKEVAKLNTIISNLYMYENDTKMITKQYTDVLNDDNVVHLLTKISQDPIFKQHFPEIYEKNIYGENVINCQQNSVYHKYGVFKHILHTVELVGNPQIQIGDWQRMILKWTMLLHDIGKPYVKVINEDGSDSFAGHDDKSVELAVDILKRFSFNEQERTIILTLIKYHDKFLNEGEITYDNLKFLAQELEDKKDLFYLLINVKDADAQAKSLDVYNRHKLVKGKYLEFANSYFEHSDIANSINDPNIKVFAYDNSGIAIDVESVDNGDGSNDSIVDNEDIENITDQEVFESEAAIQKSELNQLIEDILTKRKTGVLYQPIIDLETKTVMGYETYSVIEGNKKLNIAKFLRYSKDNNKYDKIQQTLFINNVESFEKIKSKEANKIFANIDIASYEAYVNKPRLYDMMKRLPVVLELHNYEKFDLSTLQEKILNLQDKGAQTALDHFGIGIMKIDDLKLLSPDYIKPDISLISDIDKDASKQKYIRDLATFCIAKDIKLLIVGIETKEQFDVIRNMGIRYVQGFYFSYPTYVIDMVNTKIYDLLNSKEDDMVL